MASRQTCSAISVANSLAIEASFVNGRPWPFEPGSLVDHQTGGVDVGGGVGEHPLDGLVVGDRVAESLSLSGILTGGFESRLGQPNRQGADADPPAIQHRQGLRQATTFRA